MVSRKAMIRLMLWFLVIGAGAGVMGALFGSYSVVFRVMWTAFGAAIVAGFVSYMSRLVERKRTRIAGLCGMVAGIAVFVLTLVAIWHVDRVLLPGLMDSWQIPAIAGWLGAMTLPTVGLLCLARTEDSKLAGWIGVDVSGIVFLLGMVAIFIPRQWSQNNVDGHLWMSAAWVGVYGFLVVGSLVGWARYRRLWAWLGVAAAVTACAIGLYMVWGTNTFSYYEEWSLYNVVTAATSAASVVVFANVLLLVPLRPAQRWVKPATIYCAIVTAVLIDLLVLYEINDFDSLVSRFTGAAGILTICGSLAILVLSAMNKRMQLEPGSFVPVNVTMLCPRCRKNQSVVIGESSCISCGLRITLSVEEPHCPHCDYLLYGSTGEACPECGRSIRTESSATENR